MSFHSSFSLLLCLFTLGLGQATLTVQSPIARKLIEASNLYVNTNDEFVIPLTKDRAESNSFEVRRLLNKNKMKGFGDNNKNQLGPFNRDFNDLNKPKDIKNIRSRNNNNNNNNRDKKTVLKEIEDIKDRNVNVINKSNKTNGISVIIIGIIVATSGIVICAVFVVLRYWCARIERVENTVKNYCRTDLTPNGKYIGNNNNNNNNDNDDSTFVDIEKNGNECEYCETNELDETVPLAISINANRNGYNTNVYSRLLPQDMEESTE